MPIYRVIAPYPFSRSQLEFGHADREVEPHASAANSIKSSIFLIFGSPAK